MVRVTVWIAPQMREKVLGKDKSIINALQKRHNMLWYGLHIGDPKNLRLLDGSTWWHLDLTRTDPKNKKSLSLAGNWSDPEAVLKRCVSDIIELCGRENVLLQKPVGAVYADAREWEGMGELKERLNEAKDRVKVLEEVVRECKDEVCRVKEDAARKVKELEKQVVILRTEVKVRDMKLERVTKCDWPKLGD